MTDSRVPTDRKRLREALFVPPYHKRQLTDYQLEWLKDHFHDKENSKLASALNISLSTLHRFARDLKLTKSETGMRAIKKRQAAQIKKVCEENGYYNSLRGKAPCAAALEATRRLREAGFVPLVRLKEISPYRYRKCMKERSERRRLLISKERRRIRFGMEPQTRLGKILQQKQFSRKATCLRYNMLKKGYILGDKSFDSDERWVIYYDCDTIRSAIRERNAVNCGFKILPLPVEE